MATVRIVDAARINVVNAKIEGTTPIRPLRGVLLRLDTPRTDEWPVRIPPGTVGVGLSPDLAKQIGKHLIEAARRIERLRR